MKRMFFLTAAILASVVSIAQRNDLYSSASQASKPTVSVTVPAAPVTVASTPAVTTTVSSQERDVDEYNRRYSYSSSNQDTDYSYTGDSVVHDTVYVKSGSYAEGYNDAAEEYEYALRMARFHSVSISLFASPFYWDVFYNPWYPYGWRYGWVYYDPWYYGPYYPGWYPGPIYVGPVYMVSGVYVRRDRFVPDRRINSGWDRQLAGGARRERDYLAASGGSSIGNSERGLSSGRNSISDDSRRNVVSRTPSDMNSRNTLSSSMKPVESRSVEAREKTDVMSRSNSSYAGRDRSTSTPARNLNTTSRQISDAVTSRSSSSGYKYTRPSSTSRGSATERSSANVSAPSVSHNTSSISSGSSSVGRSIGGGSMGGGSMGGSMGGGARGGSGFGGRR